MAERKRSKDGSRASDKALGAGGSVSQSGRTGGRLSRGIGIRDELKRNTERPGGHTRVETSDERRDPAASRDGGAEAGR